MVVATTFELAREPIAGLWDELMPLLVAQHAESWASCHPLGVHRQRYEQLDHAGFLRVYTMRVDGRLVGYASFTVSEHIRHDLLYANHDSLYVDPAYRGFNAIRLLGYANRSLAAEGVDVVTQVAAPGSAAEGVLHRMGYTPRETIFTKRLRD